MELRQSTGHGIHLLILCARSKDEWTKVEVLAADMGLSAQNTYKIVARLKNLELIESKPGRSGGIRLAQPSTELLIGNVIMMLQAIELRLPGPETPTDRAMARAMHEIFDQGVATLLARLNRHSIAELARKKARAAR